MKTIIDYYFYFNLTMIKANDIHNNGIFKETILFAESDDVFCPVKNLTKILIKRYNIADFLKMYADYKDSKNMIEYCVKFIKEGESLEENLKLEIGAFEQ